MSKYWKIVEKDKGIWKLEDPEGWRSADVRWDGCVHYYRYYNVPLHSQEERNDEDTDYLHICELDEEIERLQELKELTEDFREL